MGERENMQISKIKIGEFHVCVLMRTRTVLYGVLWCNYLHDYRARMLFLVADCCVADAKQHSIVKLVHGITKR
jgi:hypothetical protein